MNRGMEADMTDRSFFVAGLMETLWAVGTSVAASVAPGVPFSFRW
jgi:hypothetical protein